MRYFRAFTLSLLIHGILAVLCAVLVPPLPPVKTHKNEFVDLLERPELPRRPSRLPKDDKFFVRDAPAPSSSLSKQEKEKRFASAEEQNVIEEQKARISGLTGNRSPDVKEEPRRGARDTYTRHGKNLQFTPGSPLKKLAEEEAALGAANGDIEVPKPKENSGRPLDFSRLGSIERGISTFGEDTPDDVKIGDFTALNTDRHLYYTFYSRIEEMIRHRWVNYVKAVVYGMESSNEHIPVNATWTTKIEVLLDDEGHFVKAILHESSGLRKLDAAPVQAFRDAAQFPNPPQEMVKDDGFIHVLYALHVNIVPRYAGTGENDSEDRHTD